MFATETLDSETGPVVRLLDRDVGSSALVAVGYGFNCFSFICPIGGFPREFLFAGEGFPSRHHKPSHHGTPILAPFPNRIRGGEFIFHGQTYRLPRNDHDKNAIHGLAIDRPWRIIEHGSDSTGAFVTGNFQLSRDWPERAECWPGDFSLTITYRLQGLQLDCETTVQNLASSEIPFGFGTHPYFRFPLEPGTPFEKVTLSVPAGQIVELDECLPTGRLQGLSPDNDLRNGMRLSRRAFDDVYTSLAVGADGSVRHTLRDETARAQLELIHGPEFPFAVVYTPPDRQSVCIEPYTCVTDAVRLEGSGFSTGLWRLESGESRHVWIRYVASPAFDSGNGATR